MSLKKTLFKNTAYNLIGYFYLLLASFFSIRLMIQYLGRDLFGIYIFLSSIVPLASVFDFGVSVAVVRELSLPDLSHQQKVKVWQTSYAIYIFQAVLLFVATLLISLYLFSSLPLLSALNSNNAYAISLILAITVFLNQINAHLLNLPQAMQRFDIFNSKTLLVGTANTILSALLCVYTNNLVYLFITQGVFHFLTTLYMFYYANKVFTKQESKAKYHQNEANALWSFGYKNFIGILAGQLEAQVSKIFLGVMSTAKEIAAFNIPQNLVSKGAGIVSQFAQAFFPLSTSLLHKDKIRKLKSLFVLLQSLIILGGVCSIFLTNYFGEAILIWWLNDKVIVDSAFPVLKVLIYYFCLVALTPIPTALVQGLNKPQIASFFAVLTISSEIILLYILVPSMESMGAAYAFLFSSVISVPAFIFTSWIAFNKTIKEIS